MKPIAIKGGIIVENKKTKAYNIRFTEKEYQYIKQQSELNHCSISQYIRIILLKGAILE